jgi:hypothetical protein
VRGSWLLLLSGLLVGAPATALAHDVGVIRLGAEEAPAGSELEIRGEKLSKNTEFTVVLRGALETHTLGAVRSDSAGAFTLRVVLPADASPGAYVVRLLAPDGDESARAELKLLPPAPQAVAAAEHDHHEEGGGQSAHVEATAAPLDLPLDRGPLEWALVLAISAGSLAGGLALLRRA